MKPFNLEAALRGEKVVTKNGREVKQLTKFEDVTEWSIGHFCLAGVVQDGLSCSIKTWATDGTYGHMQDDFQEFQLFMYEEPELAIWKPSACCSFRWLETQETFPRRVLQQLYVNKLKPEYEWRAVPIVQEEEK